MSMDKERLKTVENLRAFMNETGLTIGPMSKVIGCSSRQISRWLSGEAMPSAVYARLINSALKRLQARRTKA